MRCLHAFTRSQLLKTRVFFYNFQLRKSISQQSLTGSRWLTHRPTSLLYKMFTAWQRVSCGFLEGGLLFLGVQAMNQFPRSLLLVNLGDARSSTQEGHCCRKTFPWQAPSCVFRTDHSEKREGACTSFVVGKSNVYQPPVGSESPNWCLFCEPFCQSLQFVRLSEIRGIRTETDHFDRF